VGAMRQSVPFRSDFNHVADRVGKLLLVGLLFWAG
jgi:hypothetical protein